MRPGDRYEICPHCGASGQTRVLSSRAATVHGIGGRRRTRLCQACGGRFSTVELPCDALERLLDRTADRARAEFLKQPLSQTLAEMISTMPEDQETPHE